MIGTYNGEPNVNPEEVASHKWKSLEDVKNDMEDNPQQYTAWFKIIFKEYYHRLRS